MLDFDDLKFTFLYADLYNMGKDWYYPKTKIPYNMLRLIVRGEAEFYVNDEKICVKENDIVYIPQGCMLSCNALSDSFEFYTIRFITSFFCDGDDILEKHYGFQRVVQAQGEERYFKEIYKWVKLKHIARKCFIRGSLYLLIAGLSTRSIPECMEEELEKRDFEEYDLEKLMFREQKCNKFDPRVRSVADYVAMHPEEKFTPETMAGMVGLSKQRFSSLFKKNMGKSPMEYMREIKMTTAARRLLVSNEPINEIAYSIGYEDPNYFIREFKKAFGCTPNRYRTESKEL